MAKSQSTIKMEKGYYCKPLPFVLILIQVAIHNKNGKGLLLIVGSFIIMFSPMSQSTIKMEKGYYSNLTAFSTPSAIVAIHNKNGKGLLPM